MKAFVPTIAVILFLTSCCANTASGHEMTEAFNVDSIGSDYTANATAIEQKKQEMLAVADSVGYFWFSDDTEFPDFIIASPKLEFQPIIGFYEV